MTAPGVSHGNDPLQTMAEDLTEIERALGDALRNFASELRLVDAADLAAFIRIGHMPNVRSMVRSSAELYFKPGTLDIAEPGELELGWFTPPLITLPMKFQHGEVRVYFRLKLAALWAAVEVESISAGGETDAADRVLREALDGARITRPVNRGT
jgi:hypothetical protein